MRGARTSQAGRCLQTGYQGRGGSPTRGRPGWYLLTPSLGGKVLGPAVLFHQRVFWLGAAATLQGANDGAWSVAEHVVVSRCVPHSCWRQQRSSRLPGRGHTGDDVGPRGHALPLRCPHRAQDAVSAVGSRAVQEDSCHHRAHHCGCLGVLPRKVLCKSWQTAWFQAQVTPRAVMAGAARPELYWRCSGKGTGFDALQVTVKCSQACRAACPSFDRVGTLLCTSLHRGHAQHALRTSLFCCHLPLTIRLEVVKDEHEGADPSHTRVRFSLRARTAIFFTARLQELFVC